MIDSSYVRRIAPLRQLKWLSTFTASLAATIATGVAINLTVEGDGYHWSALPVVVGIAAIALAARHAIALKLDDKRLRTTD